MSGQDYEIALPDGRSIVVTAPDEKAARTAANNFMMREKGAAKGKGGGVDNFVRSLASGATFGFADEIAAAGDATFGPAVDWALGKLGLGKTNTSTAPTWGERYSQNLEGERSQDKIYATEHPGWDIGGKVVGGVTGAFATLPKFLLAGAGIGRSAATGAGLGSVAGFGEGEGGLVDRAMSAGKGAVIGGGLGAAAPVVTGALGTAANMAAESTAGRMVADKVGPTMLGLADKIAPYIPNAGRSVSAAAPDGGPPGMFQPIADTLRRAARPGSEVLDEGALRRIADATQRGGSDVPGMRAKIAELGPDAMLADLDPMTQRLARTAYISPGTAPKVINEALDARAANTGPRMTRVVNETMGDSAPAVKAAETLKGQRAGQGASNYEAAIGADVPLNVSPEMESLLKVPAIAEARANLIANAQRNGQTLSEGQIAHGLKRQLALDADAAFASGRSIDKNAVGSLAERWRAELHKANPAIKTADDAWASKSNALDALDLGRRFMQGGINETADAVSPTVLAERIPKMTVEEAQAFIAGAADTLKTKLGAGTNSARQVTRVLDDSNTNVRQKLVAMIGEDNTKKLFNRAMGERAYAATDRTVRGGSDTASKMLSAMDDAASGGIPTSPNSVVSRIISKAAEAYNKGRAGNEAVRERIARMLTDTDAAANADTISRIAEILAEQARRARGSRAIATGAAQIQE